MRGSCITVNCLLEKIDKSDGGRLCEGLDPLLTSTRSDNQTERERERERMQIRVVSSDNPGVTGLGGGGVISPTMILSLHNSTIPTQPGCNELLMFLTEDDRETTKELAII